MDSQASETMMRALRRVPSRRHVLTGLAGLGLALGRMWRPDDAGAKKKQKKKKTTLCLDGQTIQASGKKK